MSLPHFKLCFTAIISLVRAVQEKIIFFLVVKLHMGF